MAILAVKLCTTVWPQQSPVWLFGIQLSDQWNMIFATSAGAMHDAFPFYTFCLSFCVFARTYLRPISFQPSHFSGKAGKPREDGLYVPSVTLVAHRRPRRRNTLYLMIAASLAQSSLRISIGLHACDTHSFGNLLSR